MSTPGASPRESAIERALLLMDREEARSVRRVAAAYRRARQEIVEYLLTHWPTTGMDTLSRGAVVDLARRIGILRAIDERLVELERELGIALRDVVVASSEMAIDQIQREIALLPQEMRPTIDVFSLIDQRMIEQYVPIAMNDVQLGTRALSLQLQREIQNGLLQGESFPNLIRRSIAMDQAAGQAVSIWRRGALSAELMIRRLTITAANGAKAETLRVMNAQGGTQVQKQAIAVISPETTDCCIRVHGQIRDVDEPFELTGTPRFADQMMHPSFHWNCRTSIAMYHPIFERGATTTAGMQSAAAAELRRRERQGSSNRVRNGGG